MHAYASMYRLCRPRVISGHTRLIFGHTRLISGHTRLISGHRTQRPIMQFSTSCNSRWSKKTDKKRWNKQTNKQSDSHSSLLKTLREWAGKEYYRCLRMAIHRDRRKSACPKSETTINPTLNPTSITIAPMPLWISRAYPSSRPWLVCLPHSCLCAHRSSQLSCGHGDLDYCDSKCRYALCEPLWSQLWYD
jgi:hypothetical protein